MKKTVVFHSNYSRIFTGFGKNAKNVLRYLYKTGKYNLIEFSNSKFKNDESLQTLPWKAVGTLPENSKLQAIASDQSKMNLARYGLLEIDNLIKEHKPDFYIAVEDIWGLAPLAEKTWWNKNCMIWTTLDSLPLYPDALKIIPKVDHYYAWSSFAEKEIKKLKLPHGSIKTLRGATETNSFFRMSQQDRNALRKEFGLNNEFVVGFVFRNQLRKSVPNLLQGFKIFKDKNPKLETKLLLHTHWSEGWDIQKLIKDNGLNNNDILTTYFCKKCGQYEVKPFAGQKIPCKFCGGQDTQETANIQNGVSEEQLNEIYNMMDVYCHPFTSGGQEIPVTEAKLTGLITLVTNYSCGEDFSTEESGGMPLTWKAYYEPGTNFIKATTLPESIAEKLQRTLEMPQAKRDEIGKKARKFVLDNLSAEVIGKKLEHIIDNSEPVEWNYEFEFETRNPNYTPLEDQTDTNWIIDIYKNVLRMKVDEFDDGVKSWLNQLKSGRTRPQILNYFTQTATKENNDNLKVDFESLLSQDDKGRRILFVMPESAGDVFMSTSLLPSIKKLYPEYNIYFATKMQFLEILDNNPFIHKKLIFNPFMETILSMEGHAGGEGYFEIVFLPYIGTQKIFDYQHNGKDKIQFITRQNALT